MSTKIILGDNPFFGINHRSSIKADEYTALKSDFSNAAAIVAEASKLNVSELMISTHREMSDFLTVVDDNLSKQGLTKPDLCLVIPYAHKLNSLVAEKGILGLFSLISPIRLLVEGSKDIFANIFQNKKFPKRLFSAFIESEVKSADGFCVKYICLQNILTDMMLGLDKGKIFEAVSEVLLKFEVEPVFLTMNPLEADRILPKGIRICFHYNINGFMVQPNLSEVQEFISSTERPIWAMGVMASGAAVEESVLNDPYLKYFEKILFATSKVERIKSTLPKFLALNADG